MRCYRKLLPFSAALLLFSMSSIAQTAQPLSMEEAVELSIQNNHTLRQAHLNEGVAKANRHQTDAIFLPQVSVGYQALTTNDPLNAFGFLLQQRQVTSADFNPDKLNRPGNAQNYAANIEFQMPLLNMDKIFARKGALLQEEAVAHQTEHLHHRITFEVQKAYTQLQFAYKAKEILSNTLHDVEAIHQSVNRFYEQGLLNKADVLNAQVQVSTIASALSKSESNISNASDALRLLMGEDLTATHDNYLTDAFQQRPRLAETKSFSRQRADIQAMEKGIAASAMKVKSTAMNFVPTINAFGNYQFNDDKAFHFKEDAFLLGISMKWKIFSGNQNRSLHKAARLEHEMRKKDYDHYVNQSQLEIESNRREINDLQAEISQKEISVEQAAEALRISNNRHQEGLISTTDLLLSQAQLSQQQLALAQAIMQYNIARFYQDHLTQSN